MALTHLPAGFLPLLDSVLLVLAREKGFAEDEGIDLHLVKETSWANIRDRAAVGHFDVAQMLAPMPIAASLGLTPLAVPTIAPIVLGLGNNAVTVSAKFWRLMAEHGAPGDLAAGPAGTALAKVVAASGRKPIFGVVHQTSSHNYELRYWLAASGVRPDVDVEIVVLPPRMLPDAVASGVIDGYCVGEPWNSVGVDLAGAHIATVKASIWQSSPDKVIGMRTDWATGHADTVASLIRAVHRAATWVTDPSNRAETAQIMAQPNYLDIEAGIVERGLSGKLDVGGGAERQVDQFFVPYDGAANFPWKSHALWFYSQMVRWGQVVHSTDNAAMASRSFRPDLYRAALEDLGVPVPMADSRVAGSLARAAPIETTSHPLTIGPDLFFDGEVFDPDWLEAYIETQRAAI